MSSKFAQWEALTRAPSICIGCQKMLGGKPGADPPPLRTRNIAVVDGVFAQPTNAELLALIIDPPGRCVLSWATSSKRHHWFHAGISSPRMVIAGSDQEPAIYRPREDRDIYRAVIDMASSLPREEILTGNYSTTLIGKMGPSSHARAERIIARYRGLAVLELIVNLCPREERAPTEEDMISDSDRLAADLLVLAALGSDKRANNGLVFWNIWLKRGVRRFGRLPLADLFQRLFKELRCNTTHPYILQLTERLEALTIGEVADLESAYRSRPDVIVHWAFAQARKNLNNMYQKHPKVETE